MPPATPGAPHARTAAELLGQLQQLEVGMSRTRVESILGAPDHSPVPGQVYYYADDAACVRAYDRAEANCGAIVEYRRFGEEQVRDTLQSFEFLAIGE